MRKLSLLVIACFVLGALGTFPPPTAVLAATCASTSIKVGLGTVPGGSVGDGCDIHHIISQWAMKETGTPGKCWPVINIPQSPDHQTTRTYGNTTRAQTARTAEKADITANGLLQAFEDSWKLFLEDMANSPYLSLYESLYQSLHDQLVQAINSGLCNQQDPKGPPTAAAGVTQQQYPPAPPGGGGAVPANGAIAASATGVGSAYSGDGFDLILADAAQLAQDPNCNNSPVMLSDFRDVVDSAGNLPTTWGTLGSVFWESGGEGDAWPPVPGKAEICFALSSDHHAVSTAPITITIAPAVNTGVNFVGVVQVWGDVTGCCPSSSGVIVTGTDGWNGSGAMTQPVSAVTSKARHGGSFYIKTSASGSNSLNPTGSDIWYDINTIPIGYTSHTTWGGDPNYSCMDWLVGGSSGVRNVGSVKIHTDGGITAATTGTQGTGSPVETWLGVAGPFSLSSNEGVNTSPQESGVCLSDATSTKGNMAPLTAV